jgi:hypothetical protein
MKQLRSIRDTFVVQDDRTVRTITVICAVFLAFSMGASLFMARQIFDTYKEARNYEATSIALNREQSRVEAEVATRTALQAMEQRAKDLQMVVLTTTLRITSPGSTLTQPITTTTTPSR